MKIWNPGIKPWDHRFDVRKRTRYAIAESDVEENIVWQTRAGPPSDYEKALCKALEETFSREVYDLDGIVAELNRMGVRTFQGETWTASRFTDEMKRLGA